MDEIRKAFEAWCDGWKIKYKHIHGGQYEKPIHCDMYAAFQAGVSYRNKQSLNVTEVGIDANGYGIYQANENMHPKAGETWNFDGQNSTKQSIDPNRFGRLDLDHHNEKYFGTIDSSKHDDIK